MSSCQKTERHADFDSAHLGRIYVCTCCLWQLRQYSIEFFTCQCVFWIFFGFFSCGSLTKEGFISVNNCQIRKAPFLYFCSFVKIKTLPVAAAYLSARGSDGPLERDRKNHYQTSLSNLLERRHLVQAYTWQGVPLTTALTRLTLGFQARLERLWEWETLIPKVTPLPQKSHFAIHCTSHPDNYFFYA